MIGKKIVANIGNLAARCQQLAKFRKT